MNYISQFFEINDRESWRENALNHLQRYPDKKDWHFYILEESGSIIGFAFVNKHLRFNNNGFAVAEFYIRKTHQRQGYGRKLAEHVFAQFPGNWEVAVSLKNSAAREFWEQVVASYTQGKFIKKTTASFSGNGFIFNNDQSLAFFS
ncbi:MAG: GNAT family N-acetyltransferase [Candidatus Omnitrophica bacterium]|nr:GNAT family N-acetyltransferase [Candidatus Omnitrophota bacterium]